MEVSSLGMDDFKALNDSMSIIKSEEQLTRFEVAMLPNIKEDARKKAINAHRKTAETLKEKKILTTNELFKLIS